MCQERFDCSAGVRERHESCEVIHCEHCAAKQGSDVLLAEKQGEVLFHCFRFSFPVKPFELVKGGHWQRFSANDTAFYYYYSLLDTGVQ